MDKTKIEELLKVDILKELGLDALDDDTKRAIIDDAGYVIVRGAWIKLFEALSDAKQEELSSLIEGNPDDTEAIVEFLKKEIPSYEDVIKESIATYKSILLAK